MGCGHPIGRHSALQSRHLSRNGLFLCIGLLFQWRGVSVITGRHHALHIGIAVVALALEKEPGPDEAR